MWTKSHSVITKVAAKEQIWKLWSDVPNWNFWDKEVETSEIFGEFKLGTKGILKPVGGPKTKFEMIECEYLKSFTDRSFLPFCKMDFIHTMTETKDGLELTHKVLMTGFMTFFFSKVIGRKINVGLPIAVKKLIEIAEEKLNLL
ncbi:MAG: polyketide cyclase/dehydrase and lipid transport [Bacteroidales bacterium]|nr:polyketide cyclase/dehydrase and lipid transport [Bacteroidales bacterium]